MLYVSTRDKTDSFTAYRTLHENTAANGGLFVPMRLSPYSKGTIAKLKDMSFGDTVALVLQKFFSIELSGRDVDFTIGRQPYRLVPMNHRMCVAELWKNRAGQYSSLEQSLFTKLTGSNKMPTEWAKIAIRIAVLFGIYGELKRAGVSRFDVSVITGDFSDPIAAWYAKQMGLPIDKILCCCNDNSGIWDLIHRGAFPTGNTLVKTILPKMDVVCPESLERLIYEQQGLNETKRYLDICRSLETYQIDKNVQEILNCDFSSAVVSEGRYQLLLRSIHGTHNYIADPYAAVAMGGLQDYRSRTGESRLSLVLSDESPLFYSDMIMLATGLTHDQIKKAVNHA